MLPVRSVLVDFDGTACAHDVAEHLLMAFGEPGYAAWDEAWERGEIGAAETLRVQAAMLREPAEVLIAYALEHCPMDPTFASFVQRCAAADVPVTIVSDGFGLYIEPLLAANGIAGVPVRSNVWGGEAMSFPNANRECMGCGTCKMQATLEAPGPVAFIGEGSSDRYAALYADVVYAKDVLVAHCERDGVAYRPWTDFDDVWRDLTTGSPPPGPVSPVRCPGWMPRSPTV